MRLPDTITIERRDPTSVALVDVRGPVWYEMRAIEEAPNRLVVASAEGTPTVDRPSLRGGSEVLVVLPSGRWMLGSVCEVVDGRITVVPTA